MLPVGFKPMLAGKADLGLLRYPVLVSPKLDGVRAIVDEGTVISRNLKVIPNQHVQKSFGHKEFNGLDGELVVGRPPHPNAFNATTSGVMSADGIPEVAFFVFDHWMDNHHGYAVRQRTLLNCVAAKVGPPVFVLEQVRINNGLELMEYEYNQLQAGYEGIMIRSPHGAYKFGRSTTNEGWLLKLKRMEQAEAIVVGVEELMHNANEAKVNALGHSERSSHKANKQGRDTLGALIVRHEKFGEFNIGTGFDDIVRKDLWNKRNRPEAEGGIMGSTVTFRYQPAGVLDKPRFPVFVGFRDKRDM